MLKKIIKLSLEIILMLLLLYCLVWHNLVVYGIMQGEGQLSMVLKAETIDEVLADTSFADSLKQKLKLITEIKKFAVDSLGIKPSDNYTLVYNQHNKPILYTVSASEPFALKAKEWTFPFLGTVSYKGFFELQEAQKEMYQLKLNGYDIDIYSPSGWSTLGWFKDPILSSMLYKSEGQLANLIIHELTHGTIYIKNNVTYNENLANFIGDKGAQQFLAFKYGEESQQYKKYFQNKHDEQCYNDYILNRISGLDSLYKSFSPQETDITKRQKKLEYISSIALGVNQLPLHNKKAYFNYTLQAFAEGNAFFMAFSRYDSEYEKFEKEYTEKYNSSISNYLKELKIKYEKDNL